MNLYGHACGDGDYFLARCSDENNGKTNEELPSAGFCEYGSRKLGNLLDLQIRQRIEKPFVEFENFVSCRFFC